MTSFMNGPLDKGLLGVSWLNSLPDNTGTDLISIFKFCVVGIVGVIRGQVSVTATCKILWFLSNSFFENVKYFTNRLP